VKITAVTATPIAIPLVQPFRYRSGVQEGVNLVLFAVDTDEGVTGYGESICEDPAAVVSYGLLMAQHFTGQELANVEAMLRGVWTEGRWRFWPHFTQLTVSGIEVACWDALGRALGVPTSVFFGGRVRDEVDFFGFVQGDTAVELGGHAGELAALGHEVLYVKLGRSARDDEECVAAIRDAIGPDRLLRVDPNEAWGVGEAVEGSGGSSGTASTGSSSRCRPATSRGSRTCAAPSASRSRPTRPSSPPGSSSRCSGRRRRTSSSKAPTMPAACCVSASRRRSPRRTAST